MQAQQALSAARNLLLPSVAVSTIALPITAMPAIAMPTGAMPTSHMPPIAMPTIATSGAGMTPSRCATLLPTTGAISGSSGGRKAPRILIPSGRRTPARTPAPSRSRHRRRGPAGPFSRVAGPPLLHRLQSEVRVSPAAHEGGRARRGLLAES